MSLAETTSGPRIRRGSTAYLRSRPAGEAAAFGMKTYGRVRGVSNPLRRMPRIVRCAVAAIALCAIALACFVGANAQADDAALQEAIAADVHADASDITASWNAADAKSGYAQAVLQLPAWPSGCEPASLAYALNRLGIDASIEDVISVLDFDPEFTDYVYHYAGDPAGSGSAYAPVMTRAANDSIAAAGFDGRYQAFNITGTSFEDLRSLVEAGAPVLAWVTTDLQDPLFSDYSIYGYPFVKNNHCVSVYSIDDDTVVAMDPLEGFVSYDAETFAAVYEARGCMALAIAPVLS